MVSSYQKPQDPGPVTIPYLYANSSLRKEFPSLVTETGHVMVSPASLELDADAVLAIVVTGTEPSLLSLALPHASWLYLCTRLCCKSTQNTTTVYVLLS
ncbi:Integral membrane protein [Penicillium digitatum]|uniref:Integral membrane protein n=1 Tax=Penicillium digitatum TaxID=36651 RepID=A0A7T7BIC2_PENDI|nr:Integral membrane protein [Penicillium digitatum]